MARWHKPDCQAPEILIRDGAPACQACNTHSGSHGLSKLQPPSAPFLEIPPDEPRGQMNLWWPPSVHYTSENALPSTCLPTEGNKHGNRTSTRVVAPDTNGTSPQATKPIPKSTDPIYSTQLSRDELRLACLSPYSVDPKHDSLVHLTLETYKLDNCPEYEAVSYTWGGEHGDSTRQHPIYVGPYWDVLLQTRNCRDMLQFVSPTRGVRLVWVDALCINQHCIEERSTQVRNMEHIYAEASRVIVYLGPDIAPILPPDKFPQRLPLQDISTRSNQTRPSHRHASGGVPLGLKGLLARKYFSRLWIIQELMLSKRAVIRLDDVDYTIDTSHPTTSIFLRDAAPSTAAPWLQYLGMGRFQWSSICELLATTSASQAADLRDHLFGILGLLAQRKTSGDPNHQVSAEYSLSCQNVFTGFFAHCLINLKLPQILLGASGLSRYPKLPSWVPDWLTRNGWQSIFRFEPTSLDGKITHALVESTKQLKSRPKEILYSSMTFWEGQIGPAYGAVFWEERFRIDSQTGTLSTRLTRFSGINAMPVLVGEINTGKVFAIRSGAHALFLVSRFALDDIIRPGLDELYMLVVSVKFQLFLILRPGEDSQNFILVASCSDGFFGSSVEKGIVGEIKGAVERPFISASSILCINARRLQDQLAQPIQSISHGWIFPGAQHYSELLPVLLALASESWLSDFSGFREAYLKCFSRDSKPEIENSSFVLHISAQLWQSLADLADAEFSRFVSERGLEFSVGHRPWTRDPWEAFPQGKVYGSRVRVPILSIIFFIRTQFSDLLGILRLVSLVSQRTRTSVLELLRRRVDVDEYWIGDTNGICEALKIDGSAREVSIM